MDEITAAIDDYVELFHDGDEGAFLGLLEFEEATLAHLIDRLEQERESDVRVFLLEVIWQRRDPFATPLLGRMLVEADERLWRTSLDGLVALASPEGLAILRSARAIERDAVRTIWLDEAIEQVEVGLASTPRTTS
jgi:hypothetical protein